MHAHTADTQEITISARGGMLIGLSLAVAVILCGFSLALGTRAVADTQTFPAWVDQRYAGEGPYLAVPMAPRTPHTLLLADASAGR